MIAPHSSSNDSGNIPVIPLRGIRTSLLFGFFALCAFFLFFLIPEWWQDRANNPAALPTAMLFLITGFLVLPFVACYFLFSSRRVESVAAGAGVACGFFSAFVVVSPIVLSVMLFFVGMSSWNGSPNLGIVVAGLALIAFLAASLAIVWFGVPIGKSHWGAFGSALAATVLYVIFSVGFLESASHPLGRYAQRKREKDAMDLNIPGILANQRILALAGCLFQNYMQNPQAGYPASLDPPPEDWACDTKFAADAVPKHTLAYIAQPDGSGRVTDFELTAVPEAKGVSNRNPIMIDTRGLVFMYYPWFLENAVAKDTVRSNDLMNSQINFLKNNIARYTKDKNEGRAPTALSPGAIGDLGHERPSIEDDGLRLEIRDYETRYSPPRSNSPEQFALSARCKSYGLNCLRSYFVDYDGSIHATSEPRQATADDPLALRCEFAAGECPDVHWIP
jgi:hypothetical protein